MRLWSILLSLLCCPADSDAARLQLLITTCPLAGSQYYAVGRHWQALRPGDPLTLHREPDNRHDPLAIRIEWRGHQLGYLPRAHNRPIAEAIDRGDRLLGRIGRLTEHPDPWQRVVIEVYAEL